LIEWGFEIRVGLYGISRQTATQNRPLLRGYVRGFLRSKEHAKVIGPHLRYGVEYQMRSSKSVLSTLLFLALYSSSANAYVECAVTPSHYYVGDSILWVMWREGGAGLVTQSSPDFKPVLASVLAAIASNRSMTVRYADGTPCTAVPANIVGIWF
jgi:hypothetical protein